VIGHVPDPDFGPFMSRVVAGLRPETGLIVLKENQAKRGFVLDKEDQSITRTDAQFRKLFEQAGLELIATELQKKSVKNWCSRAAPLAGAEATDAHALCPCVCPVPSLGVFCVWLSLQLPCRTLPRAHVRLATEEERGCCCRGACGCSGSGGGGGAHGRTVMKLIALPPCLLARFLSYFDLLFISFISALKRRK
jgi:hypothetical protein